MARINTNVPSLIAQHNLNKSSLDLQVRLQRLSTGLRINRGADGPAALIISERLRSEIEGIGQAIGNAERASNVISTAEAALVEVSTLLTSMKSLVVEAANSAALSAEEIEANQLQIDNAVASINRIASTTSFAGLKLLNGSLDYITSGIPTSAISDVKISQATFGTNTQIPISVQTLASAQKASLFLSTSTSLLTSAVTIEVSGNKGVEIIQLGSATLSQAVFAINTLSDSTGVTAIMTSGEAGAGTSAIQFISSEYGSDQFVSIKRISGGAFFQTYDAIGAGANLSDRDNGDDVLALVNGNVALGQGTKVKFHSSALNIELQLTDDYATTLGTKSFAITGGGATYQIGPIVETAQQLSFGIQSVAAARLGNSVQGFLSSIVSGGGNSLVENQSREAGAIIDEAITQIAVLRGSMGAFERNTLQANIRSLQISLENVTSSESRIRDADFAAETAALTRAQLLSNVGMNVLATANNNAANVLTLLQ